MGQNGHVGGIHWIFRVLAGIFRVRLYCNSTIDESACPIALFSAQL
jgi:hypothetical protein